MAEAEKSDAVGINIALEFNKNTRKNLIPLKKQINTAPPQMRPRLKIQLTQLQSPHRRAPLTGATPTTNIITQFLQINTLGDG